MLARHDDEGEQPVEPHVRQYVLAKSAQLHQRLGADVEPQYGAAEHHTLDPFRAELGQVANEDGAKGDADKMGAGNAQVIEQAQNVLGHGPNKKVGVPELPEMPLATILPIGLASLGFIELHNKPADGVPSLTPRPCQLLGDRQSRLHLDFT